MSAAQRLGFSHFGMYVRDLDRMTAFYRDFMGFLVTDEGQLFKSQVAFLSRDPREHHQIVLVTGRPDDMPNMSIQQLSFRLSSLAELKRLYARLAVAPVSEVDPASHGISWSIYFRDPEGNRIEAFADTDWYIPQPHREWLDISQPEERIYADTKAFCEAQPGWRPAAAWRAELAARLAAQFAERDAPG
jgi:catechol 2,3-dioxygenase